MPRVATLTPEERKLRQIASRKKYLQTANGKAKRAAIMRKHYHKNAEKIKRKRRERYARQKAERLAREAENAENAEN